MHIAIKYAQKLTVGEVPLQNKGDSGGSSFEKGASPICHEVVFDKCSHNKRGHTSCEECPRCHAKVTVGQSVSIFACKALALCAKIAPSPTAGK